jgi:uncharacterized membrane protein YsdA (DUF1294 family)
MFRRNMVLRYGVITLAAALVLTALSIAALQLSWWVGWLLAINVVTLLTYVFDKSMAQRDSARVPERVLLLLAFVGGTPGAILGMQVVRHKTAKLKFQQQFMVVVLAQAALIVLFVVLLANVGK